MEWLNAIIMWPGAHPRMACFIFGLFVGCNLGVLLAGLLQAAREEHENWKGVPDDTPRRLKTPTSAKTD